MYVRVVCTVNNRGHLVEFDKVQEFIEGHLKKRSQDALKDWYVSPFVYGEEALEYFKSVKKNDKGEELKPKNSISGYDGEAWPSMLYWDFDSKDDFPAAQESAKRIAKLLVQMGLADGMDIFFSGNKGFHVTVQIDNKIDQKQLMNIVKALAVKAKVSEKVFDTSVYNITRIFRLPNTMHQSSGLYKIPLDIDELDELDERKIRKLAENTRELWEDAEPLDIEPEIEKYGTVEEEEIVVDNEDIDRQELLNEFSDLIQSGDRRRCIEILEDGDYGPGDRNEALVRMISYHRNEGKTKAESREIVNRSFEKRSEKHDVNPIDPKETEATLNHVFSPKWNGGTFSCKGDEFLIKTCSMGGDCCMMPKTVSLGKNVKTISDLYKSYIIYGDEADENWPKFGLDNLDHSIRIRPKNYSILAGANGSGKTSFLIQIIEHLNELEIPHLFFSLDMADSSLFEKLAAKFTQYSIKDIEKAFERTTRRPELMREIGEILTKRLPFTYFDFTSLADMNHVKRTIKKINSSVDSPVKMVFVDYTGRLAGDSDSQYANATHNALEANDVAKATNTHIMFVAQISRQHGDHTTPIRNNRVAKESGAWEENATFVMTVWRPFGNGVEGVDDKYMVAYIGKNRTGPLSECYFTWNGRKGTIHEMSQEQLTEYAELCKQTGKEPPVEGAMYHNKGLGESRKGIKGEQLEEELRRKREQEDEEYED